MNQAALYHQSHKTSKPSAAKFIEEYFPRMQWRPDGKDTLIDVGSGPGDVLMEFIYPRMPRDFTKVVCTDISPEMIDFAKNYYSSVKKCEYTRLDIATKEGLSPDIKEQFDHVTSVLCLHWIQDYTTALKNIYDLIRPEGGDCLLIFMSSHTIFDAYNYASRHSKWSEFMKNVDRFISPLHYSTNAKTEFASLMRESGFEDVSVEIKATTVDFGNVKSLKENVKSVCGVLDVIPVSQHSEFLEDFIAIMSTFVQQNEDLNESHANSCMQYDLIAAYGKKKVEVSSKS